MGISDVLAVGWRAISLRIVDLGVVVVATLIALALLNRIAPKFDMLDLPDGGRKAHDTAVPLTGGLALMIGIWIGALFATSIGEVDYEVLALLGIIATVHAFDDQSGLSARQRLVIDAVVALAFIVITGASPAPSSTRERDARWRLCGSPHGNPARLPPPGDA